MDFDEVCEKVTEFRDQRDWAQFHNLKDLAISINLEASELLELFQWSGSDLECEAKRAQMEEELADVMIYCIYFAERLGCDISSLVNQKIEDNQRKYPANKARGNARKYTEL